jgi:16S rRNA (guanine527-N7)-methyltransferase
MRASLVEVLADAHQRGLLGADPIERYAAHARGYLEFLPAAGPGEASCRGVDLGSGGGVPGLVLAVERSDTVWTLVERSRSRADWLTRAVGRLGIYDRVQVRNEPAETAGRGGCRGRADVVVARSFGPPAVVAECAAPLLRVGGLVICSDLTDEPTRWDDDGLAILGLALRQRSSGPHGTFVVLEQRTGCPERFPRAPGTPRRRPLF